MSNQKTTQLRPLGPTEYSPGDLIPIVDVSELTSPTGETKYTTVLALTTNIVSGGLADIEMPYQGFQYANGLAFDESVYGDSNDKRAYGSISSLGNQFSIFVRGFVASNRVSGITAYRTLFGVGGNNTPSEDFAYSANSAAIIISDNDLVGYVQDGAGVWVSIPATGFFSTHAEKAFEVGLTKNTSGVVTMYINGVLYASSSAALGSINNNTVVMGNGRLNEINTRCTIYDAHVFNGCATAATVRNMFRRGVDTTDSTLVASYNSNTLNGGPTQWLDAVRSNHILLPTVGAKATNPGKRFILSFPITGSSQYLGNGSNRNVLPDKYVLTSCLVESSGKPLLSVGSNSATAPVSASGTGSWNNNRVSLVSASYGVNPIGLLALGVGHVDRSIYVFFSASAAPCTFSFDGYIRN